MFSNEFVCVYIFGNILLKKLMIFNLMLTIQTIQLDSFLSVFYYSTADRGTEQNTKGEDLTNTSFEQANE